MKERRVIIIGLGPAGLSAATFFASEGWAVQGYDRSLPLEATVPNPDMRGYAFTFSPRGLSSLHEKLRQAIEPECYPIVRRVFVYADGLRRSYPYGSRQNDRLYSISRSLFQMHATKIAIDSGAKLSFNTHITDVAPLTGTVAFHRGSEKQEDAGDLIIAADGAFSVSRTRISAIAGSSHSVRFDGVRYVSVTIDAEDVARITDGHVGLHFFLSNEGTDVFIPTRTSGTFLIMSKLIPGMGILTPNSATDVALSRNTIIRSAMPTLHERLAGRPIGHFVTTDMETPYAGKCVIVGDAWNAIPAYAGQGVNASVQDVGDLFREIRNCETIERALKRYSIQRKRDRHRVHKINIAIGNQLLAGKYGNWRWRLNEHIHSVLGTRSTYQKLAFDLNGHIGD